MIVNDGHSHSKFGEGLRVTDEAISAPMEDTEDLALVQQQLSDYKRYLSLYNSLVAVDHKKMMICPLNTLV